MKIIEPSATLMEHNVPPYEFIEKVGRTCYKSEDKITEDSAEKFVKNLVKREHMAMLEHEHLYLTVTERFMREFLGDMKQENEQLKFFNITTKPCNTISGSFRSFYDLFNKGYVSTPVRHLQMFLHKEYPLVFNNPESVEGESYNSKDFILYNRNRFIHDFSEYPEVLFKHLIHTFKFVCDRGVSHEFVRHRIASFAQESTRYCNYAKDKFNNEITVIRPYFWKEHTAHFGEWEVCCRQAEKAYFNLISLGGATAQEARSVLPNSLKTEIIITATEEEWQHIVDLRYTGVTGAPHPQMKQVMSYALNDLLRETCGRVSVNKGEK